MKNYFLIELYFLETKNNKKSYFIYGLALPVLTKYKQIIQEFAVESTKIYEKNDSLLLHCYKSIVNIDINKCFSENKINLFLLNKEINLELSYVDSSTSLRNRKDTYLIEDEIESPIESFAKVTSYHTTDIISYIKNIEFIDLKNILKTLQEKTNQSFYRGAFISGTYYAGARRVSEHDRSAKIQPLQDQPAFPVPGQPGPCHGPCPAAAGAGPGLCRLPGYDRAFPPAGRPVRGRSVGQPDRQRRRPDPVGEHQRHPGRVRPGRGGSDRPVCRHCPGRGVPSLSGGRLL